MAEPGKSLKRANPKTIQDKFLVGYQGWFACPGDGDPVAPGHHGWLHWFDKPLANGGHPLTDYWPDVSEYSPSELFPATGLKYKSGEQAFLFSSRHPKTVQRHFHWMAKHGIDGAFLHRFASQCDRDSTNEGIRRIRDEVGQLVRLAAEKDGRVFSIMYDVSGVPAHRLQQILEQDWNHIVRREALLDSPNYLKEKGRPVVGLRGLGFSGAHHSPELVQNIVSFFRNSVPGGVYLMAGTPAYWRTASNDADPNPAFLDIWLNSFDAISPLTVGKYKTDEEFENFAEINTKADAELLRKREEQGQKKVDYIPVVLPGSSGFNSTAGHLPLNDIKRNGGRFLWQQIFNAKRVGSRTIYGAMWDTYDEGTCFMPVVEKSSNLPQTDHFPFLALDEEGHDLPSDWYMRICGYAAEGFRSERLIHETFPSKELQDYWASRPKYETAEEAQGSGKADKAEGDEAYKAWLATQKEDKDEPPPPPYSLEAEEPAPGSSSTGPSGSESVTASVVTASSGAGLSSTPAHVPAAASSSFQTQNDHRPQQDPVAGLSNDFSRHNISPSSVPVTSSPFPGPSSMSTSPVGMTSALPGAGTASPPPKHPSLASTNVGQPSFNSRPSSRPSSSHYQNYTSSPGSHNQPLPGSSSNYSMGPSSHSRPSTASGHHHSYSGSSIVPPQPGPSAEPPSSYGGSQWPPPDWNVNQPHTGSSPNEPVPYQTYRPDNIRPGDRPAEEPAQPSWSRPGGYGGHGGANLSRPHTFSATTSRPHSSGSTPPFRPGTTQPHQGAQPHTSNMGGPMSFPSGPPHGTPSNPYGQQHTPGGGPAFPSGPNSGPSSYGPPSTSDSYFYPSSSNVGGPTMPSGPSHISPPHSPPGATFPNTHPPYGGGNYEPAPGMGGGPQFPSGPNMHGAGYPGEAPYRPPTHPSMPNYPTPYGSGSGSSPYNPGMSSFPSYDSNSSSSSYSGSSQAHHGHGGGGPSFPGVQTGPTLPPRPSTTQPSYQPSYSKPPIGGTSTSAGAFGYALNAVDRVAGKKTKEQLESVIGTGTKLFGKFAK